MVCHGTKAMLTNEYLWQWEPYQLAIALLSFLAKSLHSWGSSNPVNIKTLNWQFGRAAAERYDKDTAKLA